MNYSEIAQSMLNSMNTSKTKHKIITVNGIQEARSFNLIAGEAAVLIDSNEDLLYIKECDSIGKSTVRAFKYEEIIPEENINGVSKKDFEDFKKEVMQIIKGGENGKHNIKQITDKTE